MKEKSADPFGPHFPIFDPGFFAASLRCRTPGRSLRRWPPTGEGDPSLPRFSPSAFRNRDCGGRVIDAARSPLRGGGVIQSLHRAAVCSCKSVRIQGAETALFRTVAGTEPCFQRAVPAPPETRIAAAECEPASASRSGRQNQPSKRRTSSRSCPVVNGLCRKRVRSSIRPPAASAASRASPV